MIRTSVAVAASLVVSMLPGPLHAWNKAGHMVTGAVAYKVMQQEHPLALAKVIALLKEHPRYESHWEVQIHRPFVPAEDRDMYLFMLAARWADDVRNDPDYYPPGENLDRIHYINMPFLVPGSPSDIQPTQPDEINIVRGYADKLRQLQTSTNLDERSIALTWVFHLIGDIHQPLHTSALFSAKFPQGDRGGTRFYVQARANNEPIHLHQFWDNLIIGSDRFQATERRFKELFLRPDLARSQLSELSETNFERWAAESFELAKKVAYRNGELTGSPRRPEAQPLPDDYAAECQKVAERRAVLAGYRLAAVLAKTFE